MSKHIKDVARLSQKKYRREEGLVVVGGRALPGADCHRRGAPREVYVAPGAPEAHPIIRLAERVVPLSARELDRLTRSLHPQPLPRCSRQPPPPCPRTGECYTSTTSTTPVTWAPYCAPPWRWLGRRGALAGLLRPL
jgi:hypothetical protein